MPRALPKSPQPIEDYGLIGDGLSAALVGRNGSIDWLCWPRFDSNACFAALLGNEDHGRWLITAASEGAMAARAYRGDTMILETLFETKNGSFAIIDFMPVGEQASSVVRIVEGRSGRPSVSMSLKLRFDYGSSVPWVTRSEDDALLAIAGPNLIVLRTCARLKGEEDLSTSAHFEIDAGERVYFTLSYGASHLPPPGAIDADACLKKTEAYWLNWIKSCEQDGAARDAIVRSLLILKALIYAPTGGIVAAATTSLPEEIGGERNWDYRYCWIRDASLTLVALMSAGYMDEAREWYKWLMRAVAGSPQDFQIMYGVAGERRLTEYEIAWLPGYEGSQPVRVGNAASNQLQLDVWGELVDAIHLARRGGLAPTEAGWAIQLKAIQHLEEIWNQPDDGIWEVRSGRQHFTFSKVMAWVAFDRSIRDARHHKLNAPVERWIALREAIHHTICEKGFSKARGTFTQSFDNDELDASLLMIPIVGFLPIDDPRVAATVAAIEKDLMRGGLVLRYRTERSDDGLPPGEGVFLACSFWLVDVYQMQGRRADAEQLFERLLALRNDLGLLSEEYEPRAKRQVGNFPQAFSHLALVRTALNLHHGKPVRKHIEGNNNYADEASRTAGVQTESYS